MLNILNEKYWRYFADTWEELFTSLKNYFTINPFIWVGTHKKSINSVLH